MSVESESFKGRLLGNKAQQQRQTDKSWKKNKATKGKANML